MRRLLFIFAVLCGVACGVAWAQDQLPAPVQICSADATTCAFTNNVTSGDILIVGAHSEGALTTPTDTRSCSWTLVDSEATQQPFTYVWICTLGSSGAETITLTGSVSFPGQVVTEYPASVGSTVDVHANGTWTGSLNSITTGPVTTTVNGDLLYSYLSAFQRGDCFAASPSIVLANEHVGGSDASCAGYRFVGTNGAYSVVFANSTTNPSGGWVILALKSNTNAVAVTSSLPSGSLTNSYSYTPQCKGGVGAYTWSASSLPTGLSINSSTGAITGTPTSGTTTPSITCTPGTSGTAATLSTAPLTINSSVGTISLIQSGAIGSGLSAVSIGDVILVSIVTALAPASNIAPPTDSLATPYRYLNTQCAATGTSLQPMCLYLYGGTAIGSGSDTIVAHVANNQGAGIAQFSNSQLFADVVGNTQGLNAGSVTLSGPSLTTLAPNSEIWSTVIAWSNGTTYTAGSGFTQDVNLANLISGEHANESSTGSYTPTFVQTGNADGHWIINGIALRPTTSGVVNTNHRRAWVISK